MNYEWDVNEVVRGEISFARDCGTIWQLVYEREDQVVAVVNFDHRMFADFYEGVTGRSFYHDYRFGHGRDFVSRQLKGVRIAVGGAPFEEIVRVEE